MAEPIVSTRSGAVRGRVVQGVRRFLGIPFAAPPVGARRFAMPEAPEPWSHVRDAIEPGATAPQPSRPFPNLDIEPLVGRGWVPGDDYLTLNVWAPDDDSTGKPVMVFIHGGAWMVGSKDVAVHDGTGFARSGVVSVAINYRMGVEGVLPIPGVPTNLCLRDMLFALAWVRDNIAGFGGDPTNVTVFGESAGAMSIGALVTSPLAKGLFRRAIIQSGHHGMTRSLPVMQRLVQAVAKQLGVAPTREGFAAASPEGMIAAADAVSKPKARIDLRGPDGREPALGISRFTPVHGDDVLPVEPLAALKAGAGAGIEVLIGTNREEMNLYFVPTGVREKLNRLLAWFLLSKVQPRAWAVLKAYGAGRERAGWAFTAALGDIGFRWPARRFAEEHRGRTHLYDFSWRSPAIGGELGACHGIELPFVFDTLTVATGPQGLAGANPPQGLADSMHRLWVGFARDGSLPWAPFDRETREVFDPATNAVAYEAPFPIAPFMP